MAPAILTGADSRRVRIAFLPLTDAAPLIVGLEKGFFRDSGLEASLHRVASWTAARDALVSGEVQASHLLFGMPIANAVGRLGNHSLPMVMPWILSRNGQAITLHKRYEGRVEDDARPLVPDIVERRDRGRPWTFAMTLNCGTHALWLRYWLGAAGVHPDRDVALFTVPPPQMVGNLRGGNLDGFCVGEPWNARALAEGLGFTAVTSQQIWPDHPEKVCAFTEEYAEKRPETVRAVLRALYLASDWLAHPGHLEEAADILAAPAYLDCPVDLILPRLLGTYDCGNGRRVENDAHAVSFGPRRDANLVQPKHVLWWLAQLRRWNMTPGKPEYAGVTHRVLRHDLYDATLRDLGVSPGVADLEPMPLFDGKVFNPADPEGYAQSFPVHSIPQN